MKMMEKEGVFFNPRFSIITFSTLGLYKSHFQDEGAQVHKCDALG